jgi:hypothetical protein
LGRASEAVRKFIDRFRDAVNAAPVDAAQEKKPSPIIEFPKQDAGKGNWKEKMAFGKKKPEPQLNKNGRMITH